MEAGNFPGDPVAKTPCSQCRGHGFDPWSENQIPHEAAKCSHVATEYPACCSEDRRSCMLQLRPSTAKQININKKKKKKQRGEGWEDHRRARVSPCSSHTVSREVAVAVALAAESISSATTWLDGHGVCTQERHLRGALKHDLGCDF